MDAETFQKQCESVIRVDELPSLSRLRQKVAGCYDIFGMCPEGEVVALDCGGRVNCLRAEIRDGQTICEEDASPCLLEARPSNILGVIQLLRDFMVTNFVTKEGALPDKSAPGKAETATPPGGSRTVEIGDAEYTDEDLGISRYLSAEEKAKRRQPS